MKARWPSIGCCTCRTWWTASSGRWTLALFAVVVVLMVAGWYYVRGRVGNLTDDAVASLQGEETLVAGD